MPEDVQLPPVQEALSLADAEALALRAHPALAAAAAEVMALESDARWSSLRPNPSVSFDLEDAFGNGAFEGLDNAQLTLAVTQVLELGGKRASRRRLADVALDVGRLGEYLALRSVLRETRVAFVTMLGAQRRAQQARDAESLLERIHDAAAERVTAGAAARAEERRAQISLADGRLERMAADRALEAASQRLGLTIGLGSGPQSVSGALTLPVNPPPLEVLEERLLSSPSLARLDLETRRAAAALELAHANTTPNLSVGAGVRRFESVDDEAFVVSLGIPLQVFNNGSAAVAAAVDRVRAARHRLDAAHRDLRADLVTLRATMATSAQEAEVLERDVVASADEVVESISAAYREGKRSLIEVLDAQRIRVVARRRLLDAILRHNLARIDVESLIGGPLP